MTGRPALRRAMVAVPFFAAIGLAIRLDSGPIRPPADAARPGFSLHDETAAAGIHFVHHRPTFDPKIANIEPHVAALGASVSVADFDGDGWPDLYFNNSRFGQPNALYRNRGDGTFEDVAESAGLAADHGGGDHRVRGDGDPIRVGPGVADADGLLRGAGLPRAGDGGSDCEVDRPPARSQWNDGSGAIPRRAGRASTRRSRLIPSNAC